jgi:serine/threonine-protein kinase
VLIDFGIARLAGVASTRDDNTIFGSAAYMAPEQLEGEPLDQRADVFGLGALLYELLTGRPPYPGGSVTELLQARREAAPVPPRRLNPSIPPALETVILTALASDPANRYADALELDAALGEALPSADDRTQRLAPVAVSPASASSRLGGRRGATIAVLAGLLALGLTLALASSRQAGEARQAALTPTTVMQPTAAATQSADQPAEQAAPPPARAAPQAPAVQPAPRPAPAGRDEDDDHDDRGSKPRPEPKGKAKGQRGRD